MCIKCKDRLFYDRVAKQIYYMDEGCNKIPITGTELAGVIEQDTTYPDVSHDDPLYDATDALKCAKATAMVNEMWNVVGVYQSFDSIGGFLDIVSTLIEAFTIYATGGIAAALAVEISDSFRNAGLDIWQAELEAVYLNEDIKAELICDLVDRMTMPVIAAGVGKKTTLYDKDIDIALERFAALVPESETAQDLLGAFPKSSWKEVVTPKIPSTECACEDYTPIPPPEEPATEPEVGEFGLYAGEVVGSIATSMTPAGSRAHGTPRGTKVSETKYTAPPYDAGIDQHATIFVMWEATEMLTQVGLDMLWKYTGSPSDGSNQAVWDFKFYYSTGESSNWQLLPGFVGELASNDSAAPGQFFGAVNFQPIPWDSALMSTDMLYIGVWMRFGIPSDNTTGIIPGGEFTIQSFKAKADSGGNYRASFAPMQFVPKTL
jgi:hypothetical protein